jgi:hypothetical protein
MPAMAGGKVREAAWMGGMKCALVTDGRLACWSPGGGWRTIEGVFTDVDVGWKTVCALDRDHHAHCWDGRDLSPLPSPVPAVRFQQIVVVSGHGDGLCGVSADSTVQCFARESDGRAPPAPGPGRFIQITEAAGTLCGVTASAQVECWGDTWPPLNRPYQSRKTPALNPF